MKKKLIKLSATQVYSRLVDDDKILEQEGRIKFYFGNVNIVVKQRDVVGNVIQEWLQGWFDKNHVLYATNPNTQMPPDFFMTPSDKKKGQLEVKAFNRGGNPGFDIADFRMYAEELIEKPYTLDVDYLIFGYNMDEKTGVVTVRDLWLKKVWEITRPMAGWPINLQIKANVVHKIRPGVWYSEKKGIPMFKTMTDFLSAFEQTVWQNPKTREASGLWREKFLQSYKKHYGKTLDIPRWQDIKDSYYD